LRNFPDVVPWVIGLFVGIELIFNGWTWVMLGMGRRNLAAADAEEAEGA
jgi:uncharacterized membrane protein HdeD (DUF308 family)